VSRKHGKLSRILMSVSGTTEPLIVLSLAEFNYDDSPDDVDTTCFEDGNKTSLQGYPGGAGTFSGFYDTAEKTFWAARKSADGTILLFYPDYTDTSHYIRMAAWVSGSISSSATGAVKVAGKWKAKSTIFDNLGS
jgi:hypothetical protein